MASNTVINEEHFYVTVSGVSVICLNHGEPFGSLFPDVSHCERAGGVLALPRSSLPLTTSRAPSGSASGLWLRLGGAALLSRASVCPGPEPAPPAGERGARLGMAACLYVQPPGRRDRSF